jgi:signal transduction histidine kinase
MFFDNGRPLLSVVVLIAGTIAAALLGVLVFVLAGSRENALRLVASRTRDLERDIERREQIEKDLKAAQAISEAQRSDLSAFAGFAAHDLKAPLTLISGYLELIRNGLVDESIASKEELPDFADRAIRASRRMRSFIDALLTFARTREMKLNLKEVQLDDLVAGVVEGILEQRAAEGGAAPHVVTHEPYPSVYVDEPMVRQVFENLIGNAVKYVKPGVQAEVEVMAGADGDQFVEVIVADRGIGVPEDRFGIIFEGFVRADDAQAYAGTGLGLAICKRVVERLGGSIRVEANPGGGSRFLFTLPAAHP